MFKKTFLNLRDLIHETRVKYVIKKSGLLDVDWYLENNPDVGLAGVDPVVHYLRHGVREGRDPAPWFSTKGYLKNHPDVTASGVNPFFHYIKHGGKGGGHEQSASGKTPDLNSVQSDNEDYIMEMTGYLLALHGKSLSKTCNKEASDFDRIAELFSVKLAASAEDELLFPINSTTLKMHMDAISGYFDREWYLANNPDVVKAKMDPLKHYCQYGWKELRNPGREFDVWWYWEKYLNPKTVVVDPLLHYVLIARESGCATRHSPPVTLRSRAIKYRKHQKIKRICLFAAYDAHGLVDDYVVAYLRELAKFADIYYLADCEMQQGELNKLNDLVKQAWAVRHGEYDFGSYSRLARDLVGWHVIDQYDELMLVNDSCWLLRPLDHVFSKMDALETDWWGMQATKGLSVTREKDRELIRHPVPLAYVKKNMLTLFEHDYNYNFHIGSYFTVFRKDVVKDFNFRSFIDGVTAQNSKYLVIKRYEFGIARKLIHSGYQFETFIDDLYPFHPIYDDWKFELIAKGFPLFKRFMLENNHYYVSGLGEWKKKILDLVPDADVDTMEKNLFRVADNEKLYRNFRVQRTAEYEPVYPELHSNKKMMELDKITEKHDYWWAFPVCAYDHFMTGNDRAMFELVRHNKKIKKIILTRSKHVDLDGENVEIVPLKSREGQEFLLRSKVVFIKHTVVENVGYPLSSNLHHFIGLWHGIPLKRIGYASLDLVGKLDQIGKEHERLRVVISSSKIDSMAMASGFYPLNYHDVWMTGLPRNDFIMREMSYLPTDFQCEEEKIRRVLGKRKLILFCPTLRNGSQNSGYQFSDDELSRLNAWLYENDVVIGIREHMADKSKNYSSQLQGDGFLNVSSVLYPNIEVLFRVSSCLITDYSSAFVDYILTGKHQISFAWDIDSYQNSERGMFYGLDFCFPGDICHHFNEVIDSLEAAKKNAFMNSDSAFAWKKRLFFHYVDDHNSERVANKIVELLNEV